MERIRQLTPRNWGSSLASCIARIKAWLRGWHGFFGIASPSVQYVLRALDAHIRRRLRAIVLRHGNANARSRGVSSSWAANPQACGYRSTQDTSPGGLSHTHIVDHCLNRAFFRGRGLVALVEMHRDAPGHVVAPESPQLALWV